MEPEQVAPVSKKNVITYVAISAILSAAISGGVVYGLERRRSQDINKLIDVQNQVMKTFVEHSSDTATTTESHITLDSVTGLKTYSDSDLGFSVQFPAAYSVEFDAGTGTLGISDDTKAKPNAIFTMTVKDTSMGLDAFIANLKSGSLVSSEQKTTLGRIVPGYEGVDNGIISQYGLYAVANGKSYELRFPTNNGTNFSSIKGGLSDVQKAIIASLTLN